MYTAAYLSMQLFNGFGRLRRLFKLDKGNAGGDEFSRVRTLLFQHVHVFHLVKGRKRGKREEEGERE